jgi:hypothetical protein
MFGWRSRSRPGTQRRGRDARRARRLRTNTLTCDLGAILDISRTGMRVRCPSKPSLRVSQVVPLCLESSGQRLRVSAIAVWIKRRGFRAHEIGLHFVNLTLSLSAAIEALATFGFVDLDTAARTRRETGPAGEIDMSVELPNYYELLGITASATDKEIQQAFRNMARKYHPDVCSDPSAAQHFIQVTEAYEILRDSRSRKSYDMRRRMVG